MKASVAVLTFLGAVAPALAVSAAGATGVVHSDADGSYMVALTGERIPVFYQSGLTKVTIPSGRFAKRQSTTYTPPDGCTSDSFVCNSLASDGSLKATCVDCSNGYGNGAMASPSIDCRNSGDNCQITFMNSVTNTDTISESITFGGTIGDTGEAGASGTASFGLSETFSTSVTKGQSLGLSIPQGKVGYVQYQPPAVLGTVVTSQVMQNFCNGVAQNMVCGSAPGILATSSNDANGQYSVVITG